MENLIKNGETLIETHPNKQVAGVFEVTQDFDFNKELKVFEEEYGGEVEEGCQGTFFDYLLYNGMIKKGEVVVLCGNFDNDPYRIYADGRRLTVGSVTND